MFLCIRVSICICICMRNFKFEKSPTAHRHRHQHRSMNNNTTFDLTEILQITICNCLMFTKEKTNSKIPNRTQTSKIQQWWNMKNSTLHTPKHKSYFVIRDLRFYSNQWFRNNLSSIFVNIVTLIFFFWLVWCFKTALPYPNVEILLLLL